MEVLANRRENPSRSSVPEYDPVAGVNSKHQFQDFNLLPDERREIRVKRPASHTKLSTFYFYIMIGRLTQEGVY
jgi:hypothetical protein